MPAPAPRDPETSDTRRTQEFVSHRLRVQVGTAVVQGHTQRCSGMTPGSLLRNHPEGAVGAGIEPGWTECKGSAPPDTTATEEVQTRPVNDRVN